ncbi:MAG: DnaA regulatory inactivator Hda [Halofilum sp. (in: g-proteobacteria)]
MTAAGPRSQLPLGISLAPGATFDAYYPGANGFAVGVLQAMAAGRGEPQTFVAAASGLGKSHLLQAACHAGGVRGARVAYLPLDAVSELSPEALEGLDQLDLVALDAVEAVLGEEAWERSLFVLINAARDAGTRLIFAARRPPAELTLGLPDLRSRLGWGPVLALEALSDEQKRDALEQRAAALGLGLPPAVSDYLLRHYPRDLAGQLDRLATLDQASLATGRRLTVPFVKEVLGESRTTNGSE